MVHSYRHVNRITTERQISLTQESVWLLMQGLSQLSEFVGLLLTN